MAIDPNNPVVKLCAEGMAHDGVPGAALELFMRAWERRTDDLDAAIAAHYVARHQPSPAKTLRWNAIAAAHAERVTDGRAAELFASLYLNLADALRAVGRTDDARATARRASDHLGSIAPGGYRDLLTAGLDRLRVKLGDAPPVARVSGECTTALTSSSEVAP